MYKHIINVLAELALIQIENERKIQECIDKYWNACKYPRKIKKKMRKEANKDYKFWISLNNLHKSYLNLNTN